MASLISAALKALRAKQPLPTSLSSRDLLELSRLEPELMLRAQVSARTESAAYLQDIGSGIDRMLQEQADPATIRLELKRKLIRAGYTPTEEERGTLKDLSSEARRNVVVETNYDQALGLGAHVLDQDEDRLDAWPAQELYRLEERQAKRPWGQRWNDAIDELGSQTSAQKVSGDTADEGMYALKNDPIWSKISVFNQPFPPFDFGSGMWVRDVSLEEAIDLGLIKKRSDIPKPEKTGLNDNMQLDVAALDEPLADALVEALKGLVTIKDGILSLVKS